MALAREDLDFCQIGYRLVCGVCGDFFPELKKDRELAFSSALADKNANVSCLKKANKKRRKEAEKNCL